MKRLFTSIIKMLSHPLSLYLYIYRYAHRRLFCCLCLSFLYIVELLTEPFLIFVQWIQMCVYIVESICRKSSNILFYIFSNLSTTLWMLFLTKLTHHSIHIYEYQILLKRASFVYYILNEFVQFFFWFFF